MATQNHPGLYSFGNVELDSTPGVNMYTQLMARKQAKEEALDQYDRERLNSINDKGLRDVDRSGLDKRLNDIRTYYNQNKQQIRKGGAAQYNYEKMFRDVNSYINRSKEATAKQEAAMGLYRDKLKLDGRIPDDFITAVAANDKGLDEKDYAGFDTVKWLSSPKPFNQQTHLKKYADLKRSAGMPIYEKIPDNPLKLNEVIVEKFDDGAKQVIAARSANDYENSYSFASQVQEEMKDPISRAKLEKTFKEQFGTMPQSPTDYATAFNMEILQPEIRKTKPIDNKEEITRRSQEFQREMTAVRNQNSINRLYIYAGLQANKPMSPNEIAMGIDNLIVNHIKTADANNGELLVDAETYKVITGQPQTKNSYLTVDAQGNYKYGKRNPDTGQLDVTTLKEVPYQLTKGKLTEAYPKTRPVVNQPQGQKTDNKTYNVIDPKTGKTVLSGVTKEQADKAKAKGYKIQ